jgi:hypothetical protein
MAKVVVSNHEDGMECVCFLSGKPFTTSKGVIYMLNGNAVCPEEALSEGREIEFSKDFKAPPNFNTRSKMFGYVQTLGIQRTHPSYYKVLSRLCDGLPMGENIYEKTNKEF